MRYHVTLSGAEVPVELTPLPGGRFRVSVGGAEAQEADVVPAGGSLSIRIGARIFDLMLEGTPPTMGVVGDGKRFYAQAESERARALAAASRKRGAGAGDAMITSPMPGRVLKVLVAEGDEVAVGQSVVVVEAMKMENELKTTKAGKVAEIFAQAGATVEAGAKLVRLA